LRHSWQVSDESDPAAGTDLDIDAMLAAGAARGAVAGNAEERCARLERALAHTSRELQHARREMAAERLATRSARLDTIRHLVAAAECRDGETAAHIERIGHYSEVIARALGLPADHVASIAAAAPMHDVGKLGVPDSILLKSSPLTPGEREIMKQHTVVGARILEGSSSPLLRSGAAIALSHHERWDGAGYPFGLAGEAIPLEARICAVADVFDALSSDRRYREALPLETVFDMLGSQRGRHFDPRVLDAFLACRAEVEAVYAQI
jgi:putative two-component system response regulator